MSCLIYCYAECHYGECCNAECYYAECHYAECHYAECCYAECHGAISETCVIGKKVDNAHTINFFLSHWPSSCLDHKQITIINDVAIVSETIFNSKNIYCS